MTPAQKKAFMVTLGLVLLGVSESLTQTGVVPAAYGWIVPLIATLGGYLKGGALMRRPGDEQAPDGVGPLPADKRPTKPD